MVKKIKKAAKKSVKKVARKTVAKKSAKKMAPVKKQKSLGVITHYYSGIGVGIIKCAGPLKVGDNAHFKGATTDFVQVIDSMQYDRAPITAAKKGQEIGVKMKDRVREGDEVYPAQQ